LRVNANRMTNEVGAKLLNLEKPGIVYDSRQRKRANEVRLSRIAPRESNSHLKGYPALLRNHRNRSTQANHFRETVEEPEDLRLTASEERLKGELPTRVPHIARNKLLFALRAFPKWRPIGFHRVPERASPGHSVTNHSEDQEPFLVRARLREHVVGERAGEYTHTSYGGRAETNKGPHPYPEAASE